MSALNDHNINYIEIKCGAGEILFHTNIINREKPEEKLICFSGVLGHNFVNVLEGNLIFDIAKTKPEEFFKSHKDDLQEYHKFGLRLNCSNPKHFLNSLNLNGVSIYIIESSYGLSGWIIAKEVKIIEK